MKIEEYMELHKKMCDEARELSQRKNNDYADPSRKQDDPFAVFANFRQCEHLGICKTEQGFLVRLSDKFSRLANLLADGHTQTVMDESVEDTMKDIINYICLLKGYLTAKAQNESDNNS